MTTRGWVRVDACGNVRAHARVEGTRFKKHHHVEVANSIVLRFVNVQGLSHNFVEIILERCRFCDITHVTSAIFRQL